MLLQQKAQRCSQSQPLKQAHPQKNDKCLPKLIARRGRTNKLPHGSDVSALKSCPPPLFIRAPQGGGSRSFILKWTWLLLSYKGCRSASKGFWHLIQHLWCHQQLTCHKTFENTRKCVCVVGGGGGTVIRTPSALCIKQLRLQTEWLLLESDSIICVIP